MIAQPDPADRLLNAFRRLVLSTFPALRFYVAWEYIVQGTASDGSSVDAVCSDKSAGMPDLSKIPTRALPGGTVKPANGSTVTVVFANGDPAKYKVIAYDPNSASSIVLQGGTNGAARVNDPVNAGYLVLMSTGTLSAGSYFPGTAAGLAAANAAAAALVPAGSVVGMTGAVITGGSVTVRIG